MTPRQLGPLQEAIIDAIKRAHPGTKQTEIASVASVDDSEVSHWKRGTQKISIFELVAMVRAYGAGAVLGPLAALDGHVVVPRVRGARACVRTFRKCLWRTLGHVDEATTEESEAGAAWSMEEAREALPDAEAALVEFQKLVEELRVAAAGPRAVA